ncbi:HsdM family class I SAM-dependent methyltransferase [Runella limosa]|uniref:HsdM family class I SAM-dependent methyltransferase n=1 Tax=Runella limosa TaxID=370978 RepID=UPI0004217E5F|nr:N-6 DNA methylase [Runella limosa]
MKNATRYLSQKYSTNPWFVDRLIISAFLYINKIQLNNNLLLLSYCIQENDDDFNNLVDFTEIIINIKHEFLIEDLIELFEFVISPSDRIINGAIYTPTEIREYIVSQAFLNKKKHLSDAKIADVACGCSGFLYTAAKEIKKITGKSYQEIFKYQIFGLDIQEYSITRSKLLLTLLALSEGEDIEEFHFNLHQGDALIFKWQDYYENFEGFQIILGNPPYVCARNLEDSVKENLKHWSVCTSGNSDLYIPFFQIGYENLASSGILGFITMNTFFKSLNGRALRKYFDDNKISIKIIDFGTSQIFKSKSTYTCICFLEKKEQAYVEYYKSSEREFPSNNKQYYKIAYTSLDAKKGWNLNNNKIISKIEATGKPFGELYKTRHGIATLRNDIYIFKPVAEDKEFYYLQNGSLYPIEKGICKDILNSNKLSRVVDFEAIKEKVLFPYNDEKRPKALEEEDLKARFPKAYTYLQKKKEELKKRDKGNGNYEKWFAFGRTQSLEKVGNKLFFPKISDQTPNYLISNDDDLLFYNGQAIIGHDEREMRVIKKIMESRLFWYYIKNTSKPYSSDYYSLNGNYINNFGVCDLSASEVEYLLIEDDRKKLDCFFEKKYDLQILE